MVAVQCQAVGGVGLQLEAVPARLGGDLDQRKRLFEITVVVGAQLSDQQGFLAGTDGLAFDVEDHEGSLSAMAWIASATRITPRPSTAFRARSFGRVALSRVAGSRSPSSRAKKAFAPCDVPSIYISAIPVRLKPSK